MPALETLIRHIRDSKTSFYRDLWGGATSFDDLPTVSAEDFAHTPLFARRYKDVPALGRICTREGETYAWEWAREDIRHQKNFRRGRKPAVVFSNHHDALFFSVQMYENGAVPIISERVPESSVKAIETYGATDLLVDMRSLEKVSSLLIGNTPVKSVVVIDTSFDFKYLSMFKGIPIRAALFAPEAGVLAVSAPITSEDVTFEPAPDVISEYLDSLHVSRARLLVTPIIRMKTGIEVKQRGERSFSLVL